MVNLSHAKKAQALASDLDYRTRLHDYTVLPDDMKVQQAKKAYQLQSDVRRRKSVYMHEQSRMIKIMGIHLCMLNGYLFWLF